MKRTDVFHDVILHCECYYGHIIIILKICMYTFFVGHLDDGDRYEFHY